jgi:Histone methylation protein DOT1
VSTDNIILVFCIRKRVHSKLIKIKQNKEIYTYLVPPDDVSDSLLTLDTRRREHRPVQREEIVINTPRVKKEAPVVAPGTYEELMLELESWRTQAEEYERQVKNVREKMEKMKLKAARSSTKKRPRDSDVSSTRKSMKTAGGAGSASAASSNEAKEIRTKREKKEQPEVDRLAFEAFTNDLKLGDLISSDKDSMYGGDGGVLFRPIDIDDPRWRGYTMDIETRKSFVCALHQWLHPPISDYERHLYSAKARIPQLSFSLQFLSDLVTEFPRTLRELRALPSYRNVVWPEDAMETSDDVVGTSDSSSSSSSSSTVSWRDYKDLYGAKEETVEKSLVALISDFLEEHRRPNETDIEPSQEKGMLESMAETLFSRTPDQMGAQWPDIRTQIINDLRLLKLRLPLTYAQFRVIMQLTYYDVDAGGGRAGIEKSSDIKGVAGDKNAMYGGMSEGFVNTQILQRMLMSSNSTFLDLGAGIGQISIQVAAQTKCRAIGIEFIQDRCDMANNLLSTFDLILDEVCIHAAL